MSEFSDNVKHRLLGIGLLNLDANPELLEILQCYFSGIWNISDATAYEKNIFTTIYTYADNTGLERIFNRFYSEYPEYIRYFSLNLLYKIDRNSYRYISLSNSGISVYVDKAKLDQCFLGYSAWRRIGFSKNR